jgi:hypothetical protein
VTTVVFKALGHVQSDADETAEAGSEKIELRRSYKFELSLTKTFNY